MQGAINNKAELQEIFWNRFLTKYPGYVHRSIPQAYYFCDNEMDANQCAKLVTQGIKQATATSQWYYDRMQEALPQVNDLAIVTNWYGEPKAVINTTRVESIAFYKITAAFAQIEGEGDKSLDYWRKVHIAYYSREMTPFGESFNENMIIICEYFQTIYTGDN